MKKLLLAGCVVVAFVVYSLHQRQGSPSVVLRPSSSGSRSTAAPAPTTTTPPPSTAAYKDGQYTGTAADAVYGNIQVKAIIQGGKLTDVEFLEYPNDRSNSVAINQQAMPLLRQEAVQAQSGQVDIVSGATDTSEAFVESLTSALAQAHT